MTSIILSRSNLLKLAVNTGADKSGVNGPIQNQTTSKSEYSKIIGSDKSSPGQLVSRHEQLKNTIIIKPDMKNVSQDGVRLMDKNGGIYNNRVRHGYGVYTWFDGRKYDGEWDNGKPKGQGTMTFANGDMYVGQFQDGKRHGQGKMTFANRDTYVGEFQDGKLHGKGTLTFANGNVYQGEFKNGKQHGQGTLTSKDGKVLYKGNWDNGKRMAGK